MSTFSFSRPESFKFECRTIGIVVFPGVEALDITGPSEVFNFANLSLQKQGISEHNIYSIKLLAKKPGPVTTMSGLQLVAPDAYGDLNAEIDTLLIPGGDMEQVLSDTKLIDWIKAMSPKVRRLVSVCTGAFLLAEAGLLEGCKATTHWNYCQRLAREYPGIQVKPDYIFIQEGHIFTSGGITSGIDLALALLEEDWGRDLALFVARFLVVFLKRPGGQSQFSSYLACEASQRPDLRELQAWIIEHVDQDMRIEALAERMAMSPRNFARLFLTETGMTPAKFVEMTRIDRARHLLETGELSVEAIASQTGFKDAERMRRAFIRLLAVNPRHYRQRFGQSTTA
ncbi:GlxA family transcriptional regulator [Methylomonas sp. LL1]|uniref:GlxA family transcriptional regulator n=1 Tax=Methylomonas sp. LL1 TaxID=2785785 RepID=UPI0018C38BBC|nr:GlxA family transcriptional regulator [Methylomonas sp. LL1]QPK61829.1 GlxA family transcriptional regulator [Methylomonas sp. LL1]